jgi:ABC-type glycerol-3-phosphate transport system substrate-binding protein
MDLVDELLQDNGVGDEGRRLSRNDLLKSGVAGAIALAAAGRVAGPALGATRARAGRETLTFLSWQTGQSTPFGNAIEASGAGFAKSHRPAVNVKFQAIPSDTVIPYITSAARSKQLASNVTILPGQTHAAVFPAFETFGSQKVAALKTQLSGWGSGVRRTAVANRYVGIPWTGQGVLWYYNKALFAKAGLDPNKPPQNFDEFANACTKLKAAGIVPIAADGQDGYTPWFMFNSWTTQFFPTAEDIQAFALGHRRFNEPGVKAAFNAASETYSRGWWDPNAAGKNYADVTTDFGAGKAAMICGAITGFLNWGIWDQTIKGGYGVFSAPLLSGSKLKKPNASFSPSLLLCVANDAKDPDLAWQLNEYMASKKVQSYILSKGGAFPNRFDIDLASVSGSPGAGAIGKLLAKGNPVDGISSWLNSAAGAQAYPLLGAALTAGDVNGYTSKIDSLQRS